MSATTLNEPLLNRILTLIDTQPQVWEQASWIGESSITKDQADLLEQGGKVEMCGTKACVAGWAMLLCGEYVPDVQPSSFVVEKGTYYITDMRDKVSGIKADVIADEWEGGAEKFWVDEGTRLLGIDEDQGEYIFLNMEYDSRKPHTFTDQVRHFLGLPLKWGTEFGIYGYVAKPATDERNSTYDTDEL